MKAGKLSKALAIADPLKPLNEDFLADPYPSYRKMREAGPICWSEASKSWYLTSYELISEITKDLRFEKRIERWKEINPITRILPGPAHLIKSRKNWMLNENPPRHTELRSLVNRAFSPKMVMEMREHIQEIADKLIDSFISAGKVEFISEFAFLLPVTVIAEMLGVPASDHAKFRQWSCDMSQTLEGTFDRATLQKSNKANDDLIDYLRPLLAQRKQQPKNDLISALILAEENGVKLTDEDILGNVVLILLAGHETTVNLIGNGIFLLLKHPFELEKLKKNPELIDQAVEEILRFDSPVQTVRRLAGQDMSFHGQELKKGELLVLFLGAANRDPEIFAEPDNFDISRSPNKHLSFSSGIHHCLGASLARLEAKIAISTILSRLPNLRLAGNQSFAHKRPFELRGYKELYLEF